MKRYEKYIEADGVMAWLLDFLDKATDTDWRCFKEGLRYVYIEPAAEGGGLSAVSTDGRRLHAVELSKDNTDYLGITPGYWKIIKDGDDCIGIARLDNKETEEWSYVKWRDVIPKGDAKYKTTFAGFDFSDKKGEGHERLAKFLHDFPDLTALNLAYLADLGQREEWDVKWYGPEKPLKFTNTNRMALIMPMAVSW
jgi:hypothetical protein